MHDLIARLSSVQVGDISNLDREQKILQMQAMKKQDLGMFSQSELDLFMVILPSLFLSLSLSYPRAL